MNGEGPETKKKDRAAAAPEATDAGAANASLAAELREAFKDGRLDPVLMSEIAPRLEQILAGRIEQKVATAIAPLMAGALVGSRPAVKVEADPRTPEPAEVTERRLGRIDQWATFDRTNPTTFTLPFDQGTTTP